MCCVLFDFRISSALFDNFFPGQCIDNFNVLLFYSYLLKFIHNLLSHQTRHSTIVWPCKIHRLCLNCDHWFIIHVLFSFHKVLSFFPPHTAVTGTETYFSPVHADFIDMPKSTYHKGNAQPTVPAQPVNFAKFVDLWEVRHHCFTPHHKEISSGT